MSAVSGRRGVGDHGVDAGGHAGHVIGTGASVGDRGVHTGAHVASVGAGGGLDRHGVGVGAHVGHAGAGANVGGHDATATTMAIAADFPL